MNKVVAPAGMIDTTFGVSSIRQLPPLMAVEITSAYNCNTGYSWRELRGAPGVGAVEMGIPLEGNLAYDLAGSTDLQPGTKCLLSIDRDQTIYWIVFVFLFEPCCPTGSGSGAGVQSGCGSGSGAGCDTGVSVVEVINADGIRSLSAKVLRVGLDGNRLVLDGCDIQSFDLGPGGVNPGGITTPIVTNVCPIIENHSIQYLDWDSNPQTYSWQSVSHIVVERRLATLPIVEDDKSCVTDPEDCCGSGGGGSGSGPCGSIPGNCTTACGQCATMSARWSFTFGALSVTTCHLGNPSDGNPCRFVSADLNWQLSYDASSGLWILEDFATGTLYFNVAPWNCTGANLMEDINGNSISVSPANLCGADPVPCSNCSGGFGWPTFEFTIAGVTTDGCNIDCATLFNRTVRIEQGYFPEPVCTWSEAVGRTGCNGLGGLGWRLLKNLSGDWTLSFEENGGGRTYLFSGTWDCMSPLVLTLQPPGGFPCSGSLCCDNWPATITITPV